jgi:hypothetical protein
MTLIILAGVWALAFGHISLTQSLKMKGNDARIFGVALIVVAAFVLPQFNGLIAGFIPRFVARNEALHLAFDMLVGAFGVYATGWLMTQVMPKLRIPNVTVSLKRQRSQKAA